MVIFIGDLMRQAERYLGEGLHPRVLVEVRAHGQSAAGGWKLWGVSWDNCPERCTKRVT